MQASFKLTDEAQKIVGDLSGKLGTKPREVVELAVRHLYKSIESLPPITNGIKAACFCICGCGQTVGKKFARGHEAKLRAHMKRMFAGVGLGTIERRLASQLGWTEFLCGQSNPTNPM